MTRILALDPASIMGFAHGPHNGVPVHGVHRLPVKSGHSRIGLALEEFLIGLIRSGEIEAVYFEKPVMPKVTSFDAMAAMVGKAFVIGMTCARLGIHAYPIDMQTWRSEFGVPTAAPRKIKGTAERRAWVKQQTIHRCEVLGFEPKDDNSADALGLWHCAAWRMQKKEDAPSLFSTDIAEGLAI